MGEVWLALAAAIIQVVVEDLGQRPELERLRKKLRGNPDPEKAAVERALAAAYKTFASDYPDLAESLFDAHFLGQPEVARELAKLLTVSQKPDPAVLARLWRQQFPREPRLDLRGPASAFLRELEQRMGAEEALRPILDSRALNRLYAIEANIEASADSGQQSVTLLREVRDELRTLSSANSPTDAGVAKLIYVSCAAESTMQPFRAGVVNYLRQRGYDVAPRSPGRAPSSSEPNRIDACALFIGLYGHTGSDVPLDLSNRLENEFQRAVAHNRRILIFKAAETLAELRSVPPTKPPYPPPPARPVNETPAPPVSTGLWRGIDTLVAWTTRQPTPAARDRQAKEEYESREEQKQKQWEAKKQKHDADYRAAHGQWQARGKQYQDRLDKHRAVLSEVDRHFHSLDTYDSAATLIEQVAEQLAAFDEGRITGLSLPATRGRWRGAQTRWAGRAQDAMLDAAAYDMPSPLEASFAEFLAEDWGMEVVERCRQIIVKVDALLALRPEIERPKNDAWRRLAQWADRRADVAALTYDEARQQLEEWLRMDTVRALGDALLEQSEVAAKPKVEKAHQEWRQACTELRRFLRTAIYGRCFLVMGASGSGKTHFLVRVLRSFSSVAVETDNHDYAIYVTAESSDHARRFDSLETIILEAARFGGSTGPEWRSLRELAAFAAGSDDRPGRLVILIDNLYALSQRHGVALDDVQKTIAAHTNVGNLYWVLAIAETHYALVANPRFNPFWQRYSFQSGEEGASTNNWISLDSLNGAKEQWEQIIRYEVNDPSDRWTADLSNKARTWLSNPFVAWVFNGWVRYSPMGYRELINLNYIEFLERFLRSKLETLYRQNPEAARIVPSSDGLEAAIYGVAQSVIEAHATEFETSFFSTKLPMEALLSLLSDMELLTLGPSPEHEYQQTLTLKNDPLWPWKVGAVLSNALSRGNRDQELADWLARHFPSQAPQEEEEFWPAVLEFLVMMLDRQRTKVAAPFLREFFEKTQTLTAPYQAAFWLAASRVDPASQVMIAKALAEGALRHSAPMGQAQGLPQYTTHYLYFLKYAEPEVHEGLPLSLRLQLVRQSVGDLGYSEYVLYVIDHLKTLVATPEELAEGLAHLHGIEDALEQSLAPEEVMSITRNLSQKAYSALQYVASKHDDAAQATHEAMLCFLWRIAEINPSYPRKDKEAKMRHYRRYWVHMIKQHVDAVIWQRQAGALSWLEMNEWLPWSRSAEWKKLGAPDGVVSTAMGEALTVSAGSWFRRQRPSDGARRVYVSQVAEWKDSQLVDKRLRGIQKETAAFLIYHTVPSTWEKEQEEDERQWAVDSTLWGLFVEMRTDETDTEFHRFMHRGAMQWFYNKQIEQRKRP